MRLIRLFIAIFLLIWVVSSCSYQNKLKRANKKIIRLTKRYPSLIKTDTILLPAIDIDSSIALDTNYSFIDSTIINFKDSLRIKFRYVVPDYMIKNLVESLKDSIKNKPLLTDTTTHNVVGFIIKFWQEGNEIRYSVHKNPQAVEYKNIQVKEPTFWEKYWWIFLIIAILIVAGILRNQMKKLLPFFLV